MKTIAGRLKHMHKIEADGQTYKKLLQQFLESNNKKYLNEAKRMSVSFVSRNIFPEEIVRLHLNAIESLYGDVFNDYKQSLTFLLESLIAYRIAHEEIEALKLEQVQLKSEIQVAANMQKTLLATKIPQIKGLDIGAITVPYHQMNGDYYHFVQGEDGALGVAIADVIGKGVPAALSMSMIKYAMDSFYEEEMSPSAILRNLNRVVERNVASNMFITMFYGQYFSSHHIFRFSSAGHEPGFLYRAKDDSFTELTGSGLVLGVLKHTNYNQYEMNIAKGDMIILLTDGVTECKSGNRFITREEVIEVINEYAHLPAQEHVDKVYNYFREQSDFELKDDFTLIIIKREV